MNREDWLVAAERAREVIAREEAKLIRPVGGGLVTVKQGQSVVERMDFAEERIRVLTDAYARLEAQNRQLALVFDKMSKRISELMDEVESAKPRLTVSVESSRRMIVEEFDD
jgi:predicted nuclease with TOPRIM domain